MCSWCRPRPALWCVSLAAPLHVERIRAVVFGERADDRLGRNPHLKGDQLYLLHRLAVIGQLELPGHQAGFLEPVQVHVQQRPGRAQTPRGAWPGRHWRAPTRPGAASAAVAARTVPPARCLIPYGVLQPAHYRPPFGLRGSASLTDRGLSVRRRQPAGAVPRVPGRRALPSNWMCRMHASPVRLVAWPRSTWGLRWVA